MKKKFLTLILIVSATIICAQDSNKYIDIRPVNNIYINVFGDASLISLNYEKLFIIHPNIILTGKIGLGFNLGDLFCSNGSCSLHNYITIPHHLTINFGIDRFFLEIGYGGTVVNGNRNQEYLIYPLFGIRFHPLHVEQVAIRLYANFPFSIYRDYSFSPWEDERVIFIPFGLSLGVSF